MKPTPMGDGALSTRDQMASNNDTTISGANGAEATDAFQVTIDHFEEIFGFGRLRLCCHLRRPSQRRLLYLAVTRGAHTISLTTSGSLLPDEILAARA